MTFGQEGLCIITKTASVKCSIIMYLAARMQVKTVCTCTWCALHFLHQLAPQTALWCVFFTSGYVSYILIFIANNNPVCPAGIWLELCCHCKWHSGDHDVLWLRRPQVWGGTDCWWVGGPLPAWIYNCLLSLWHWWPGASCQSRTSTTQQEGEKIHWRSRGKYKKKLRMELFFEKK